MKIRFSYRVIRLVLGLLGGALIGTVQGVQAQDLKIILEGPVSQSIYIDPPGVKPVITKPYCRPYPYQNRFPLYIRLWHPEGKKLAQILSNDVHFEWSGNYFNATVYESTAPGVYFYVDFNDVHQNISRNGAGNSFFLKAAWSHLPITETITIKGKVEVEFSDGTTAEATINEKREYYFHPCGQSGQPAFTPGGPCAGGTITAGRFEFKWGASGTVTWMNSPKGPIPAAGQVPSAASFKAIDTPSGPVIIYQTGMDVRYKMFSGFNAELVAEGNVGRGDLVSVVFRPGQYGSKALVQVKNAGQMVYYMFTIDQWGKAGTTSLVGKELGSAMSHMTVQYRSVVYLFEFNPANGRLTCKDNVKNWSTTIDTGIDGLVVPTATGGGPVVVYGKNNNVYCAFHFWMTGAPREKFSLGSGTLLSVNYTLLGSYGAEGTALIRTSPGSAKQVPFKVDMWGEFGTSSAGTAEPASDAGFPADIPAGFPGGGVAPPLGQCGSSADSDGDGFGDDFEMKAGTDPCDAASLPDIDMSIVLLLDKSGSMASGNKMEDAKQAAIRALSNINKKTEIGVIAYSGGCSDRFPVLAEFSQDVPCLTQAIQSIQSGGGTPLSPALLQAEDFLRTSGHGKQGLIILLCDGQNDCPPLGNEAARQINQRHIAVPLKIARKPDFNPLVIGAPGKLYAAGPVGLVVSPFQTGQTADTAPPPGLQKGGPDSIPSGQSPPEIISDMVDALMGGTNTPPEGTTAPAGLPPVLYTDPVTTIGRDPSTLRRAALNTGMAVQISTIGFGLQNNPTALKALAEVAQAGGGTAYDAQNLQQLTTAFNQAITQSPLPAAGGGGGGGFIAPAVKPRWPVFAAIGLGLACFALLISILLLRRRGPARPTQQTADLGGLDVFPAGGRSQHFRIQARSNTIGRDPGNDIVLNDPEVSSGHVELLVSNEGYFLRDLGSANGTFVNGRRVSECSLYNGDQITIGKSTIVLTQ
ncbi:MAG: FHA domain-containing protein [Candidatus Aminicenantes bacterium]|nr:FHA domain-containing protein [Candidatus Aminicenantes bacterium]